MPLQQYHYFCNAKNKLLIVVPNVQNAQILPKRTCSLSILLRLTGPPIVPALGTPVSLSWLVLGGCEKAGAPAYEGNGKDMLRDAHHARLGMWSSILRIY